MYEFLYDFIYFYYYLLFSNMILCAFNAFSSDITTSIFVPYRSKVDYNDLNLIFIFPYIFLTNDV